MESVSVSYDRSKSLRFNEFSDVGAQNEKYQFEFFNFSHYFYPWKGIDMGLYECKDIKTCHNTDGNSQKCFIVRPFEKNVSNWIIGGQQLLIIVVLRWMDDYNGFNINHFANNRYNLSVPTSYQERQIEES